LQGVDAARSLLNFTANSLGNKLLDELLEIAAGGLSCHDLEHLLADFPDLTRLSVSGLAGLIGAALGEANGEEAEEVAIGGFDIDMGLNEGLPFPHKRAKLVGGKVHAVEVGQAVLALDVVDAEFDFAEGLLLVLVEIGQGDLNDTAAERVIGVLCSKFSARSPRLAQSHTETLGPVGDGLANVLDLKDRRGFDVVPVWNARYFMSKETQQLSAPLREKGSTTFFLMPFLPFDRRLFYILH